MSKQESPMKMTLPKRVLLVEDNEDNQFLIRTYLKKFDVDLDTAENGLVGYEKFKEREYSLVLMDIQMPVMDGHETAAKIRKFESENDRKPVPVVALTAHTSAADRKKCLGSGCDEMITKPIRWDRLIEVMRQFSQ